MTVTLKLNCMFRAQQLFFFFSRIFSPARTLATMSAKPELHLGNMTYGCSVPVATQHSYTWQHFLHNEERTFIFFTTRNIHLFFLFTQPPFQTLPCYNRCFGTHKPCRFDWAQASAKVDDAVATKVMQAHGECVEKCIFHCKNVIERYCIISFPSYTPLPFPFPFLYVCARARLADDGSLHCCRGCQF